MSSPVRTDDLFNAITAADLTLTKKQFEQIIDQAKALIDKHPFLKESHEKTVSDMERELNRYKRVQIDKFEEDGGL